MKTIDLKWSLWTTDEGIWEQYAPGLLTTLQDAFEGRDFPLTINTSPRKEIRYGTVTILKGMALVDFCAVWDSCYDLIPDHIPDEARESAVDSIASWFRDTDGFNGDYDDPIGARVQKTVSAKSFKSLMEKIDECEEELIRLENKNSTEFEAYLQLIFPETEEVGS